MANSRTNNTGTKNQQNGRQAKLPTAEDVRCRHWLLHLHFASYLRCCILLPIRCQRQVRFLR